MNHKSKVVSRKKNPNDGAEVDAESLCGAAISSAGVKSADDPPRDHYRCLI